MNRLPEEIYDKIVFFLSLKEKILIRKVNKKLKSMIKERIIITYKLENNFKRINRIEIKMKRDLICEYISVLNIKLYKEEKIHLYFRRRENNNKCVAICRGEQIGYIYHSPKSYSELYGLYNKRYIPYCIECFSH